MAKSPAHLEDWLFLTADKLSKSRFIAKHKKDQIYITPLQGWYRVGTIPRALPWAEYVLHFQCKQSITK